MNSRDQDLTIRWIIEQMKIILFFNISKLPFDVGDLFICFM